MILCLQKHKGACWGLLQRCQEANCLPEWLSAQEKELWHCRPSSILTGASGGHVPLPWSTGSSISVSQAAVQCGYHLTDWDYSPHSIRLSLHKLNHSWTEMTTSPLPVEHPLFLQEGFSQGALRRGRKGTHCSGAFQQR